MWGERVRLTTVSLWILMIVQSRNETSLNSRSGVIPLTFSVSLFFMVFPNLTLLRNVQWIRVKRHPLLPNISSRFSLLTGRSNPRDRQTYTFFRHESQSFHSNPETSLPHLSDKGSYSYSYLPTWTHVMKNRKYYCPRVCLIRCLFLSQMMTIFVLTIKL